MKVRLESQTRRWSGFALAVVLVALGVGSRPAWSNAIQFVNIYDGNALGTTLTATFSADSLPFPMLTLKADTGAGTGTWFGSGGDQIDITFQTLTTNIISPTVTEYLGSFSIIGGAGHYASSSGSGSYAVTFTSDAGTGGFSVHGTNTGEISLVPEPATYALMFAGLGIIGIAARRRLH